MDKRTVRVGMVGYKFMGKAHGHAYRDLPFYFETNAVPVLQAVAGRNAEAVQAAAKRLGAASWETDWRRLIERDDIDLIDIVTPNDTHAEIAIAAAEAGKHVLCEKPLALNVEEALAMRDAAVKANVVHMVAHNYRFAPAVRYAHQLLKEGRLGTIYHMRAQYLQDWVMDPDFPLNWRLRKETSGSGALGDLLAHTVDLARFLVGEIEEVSAMTETFIRRRPLAAAGSTGHGSPEFGEVDVDDAVAVLARFAGGALGVFEASRFAGGNRNGNRFEINGSKGSLRWDLENMNLLHVYLEEDEKGMQGFRTINCTEAEHPYIENYWPPGHIIGYEHTFINLVHELMNGIAGGYSPAPNFDDGLRNQLVLEAVERAAAEKRWVAVESVN